MSNVERPTSNVERTREQATSTALKFFKEKF